MWGAEAETKCLAFVADIREADLAGGLKALERTPRARDFKVYRPVPVRFVEHYSH